jgi:Protein of unknown function (DUF3017)
VTKPHVRRRRRTAPHEHGISGWLAQLPYVLVLCGAAAGLVMVALNHFKRGSVLLAAAALLGALARLLLSDRQVGMLASRKKGTDVLIMVAFAIGIAVVAWVVPPPR